MNVVSFQAIVTAINANVSQQRGSKRHITVLFGRPMFEADKALKAVVDMLQV
jgi:hypothetical protein